MLLERRFLSTQDKFDGLPLACSTLPTGRLKSNMTAGLCPAIVLHKLIKIGDRIVKTGELKVESLKERSPLLV
jgi:hypothetical protein